MAASQCPRCGHLFKVRDGFGELLPLAYCATCQSSYPASVGSCKWCGTTPAAEPRMSWPLKRIGAGGLILTVCLGWFVRDRPAPPAARGEANRPPAATTVAADSGALETHADTEASRDEREPPRTIDVQAIPDQAPAPSTPPADLAPTTAVASPAPASPRWVNLVATDWTIIRADARSSARIVASVGPASRVRLGAARGAWREIRSRDVAGWVDTSRASFEAARRAR